MVAAVGREEASDGKLWGICRIPFWNNGSTGGGKLTTNSASSLTHHLHDLDGRQVGPAQQNSGSLKAVSCTARSPHKLYFPYEPGEQVRSAIRIKNTSKSDVAFKFQTTAQKSCFMRPPGAILSPGESIITTVFKFVEHPENNEKSMLDQRNKLKFKITSLKVEGPMEYVPEMFEEHKEQILVEQILKAVFLDVGRPNPQLEKLKHRLAEADAALEACKKPAENSGPRIVGVGLVIDEWKERRERHLARQQLEGAAD
ncbi:vesicle-associated protein 4-2-like [Phalaenopsis equestris]|uniref:vesicle-associated protein 4-2-like n=1 Tax=Phalaenopsis equestris TaxID=78828 RepID=UPI0009E534B8|nr:vesicle-associated protein 4-2-like [Phalaenopsis equestris]